MKLRQITLVFFLIILVSIKVFSERVISLSPAITEIIFKMDRGESIIGNTRFCNFPEESRSIKKIGGYLDVNIEMIIDLKPDIIFHYPEHSARLRSLRDITRLVLLHHKNLNDLLNSINIIGIELNVRLKSEALVKMISEKLEIVRGRNPGLKRRKVLIVIGRDPRQLKNITIIGKGDFINEIIGIAGGVNAYGGDISYPLVSIESIMRMDPDVIIEFSFMSNGPADGEIFDLWNKFSLIRAVRKKELHIIKDEFWVRPGPRVPKIAESLYQILHSH